jgi:hypothetical protein
MGGGTAGGDGGSGGEFGGDGGEGEPDPNSTMPFSLPSAGGSHSQQAASFSQQKCEEAGQQSPELPHTTPVQSSPATEPTDNAKSSGAGDCSILDEQVSMPTSLSCPHAAREKRKI